MQEYDRTLGFYSPRSVPSRSHRTQHANNNASGTRDDSTTKNADQFPPLLVNEVLAQAVLQVQIQMDGWKRCAPPHMFQLFAVLVEPPPGLDLNPIEDLRDYLAQLLVIIGSFTDNGVCDIATHCWWVLLGRCSTPNVSRV